MEAMEQRLTNNINSDLLAATTKPASLTVPNDTNAVALCPNQGQKKKKRRKKKKKKSISQEQAFCLLTLIYGNVWLTN